MQRLIKQTSTRFSQARNENQAVQFAPEIRNTCMLDWRPQYIGSKNQSLQLVYGSSNPAIFYGNGSQGKVGAGVQLRYHMNKMRAALSVLDHKA